MDTRDTEAWRYGDQVETEGYVVTWTFVSSCYPTSTLRLMAVTFEGSTLMAPG